MAQLPGDPPVGAVAHSCVPFLLGLNIFWGNDFFAQCYPFYESMRRRFTRLTFVSHKYIFWQIDVRISPTRRVAMIERYFLILKSILVVIFLADCVTTTNPFIHAATAPFEEVEIILPEGFLNQANIDLAQTYSRANSVYQNQSSIPLLAARSTSVAISTCIAFQRTRA